MRRLLGSIVVMCVALGPSIVRADPPVQEGPTIVVHGRPQAPSVFTTVARTVPRDRAAELRVCRLIAIQLGAPDLASYLVIIAPDKHLPDLPHALYEGLRRDIDRCLADQQALAVLVDPSVEAKP